MDEAVLNQFENALKKTRAQELERPPVLYHYTTAGGFEGIVRSRAIRATNFSFMNDPSEIRYGRDLVFEQVSARARSSSPLIAQFLDGVANDVKIDKSEIYVASFSERRDDLSQWRAYGGSTARFSLGFPTDAVDKASQIANYPHFVSFSRVVYERQEQVEKVKRVLDAAFEFFRGLIARMPVNEEDLSHARTRLSRHLTRMLPELKDPAYRAEAEWRIVILVQGDTELGFDTSRGVVRPYLLFPLEIQDRTPLAVENLVVLAPAQPDAAVKAATMVLRSVGIVGIEPRPSGIPFVD